LSHRASNRRRRRHFSAATGAHRRPIRRLRWLLPLPAWRTSPGWAAPRFPLLSLSPELLLHRRCLAGRRPSVCGMGMSYPGRGHRGLGLFGQRGLTWTRVHSSVTMGQFDPGAKWPCALFLFPKTFQKISKPCKNHI
jgi:hypothetical protein